MDDALPPDVDVALFSKIHSPGFCSTASSDSSVFDFINSTNDQQLAIFLPYLTRFALCPERSDRDGKIKAKILSKLLTLKNGNKFLRFMAVDFKQLEIDLRKDLQLKRKNLLANGNSSRRQDVSSSSFSDPFDAASTTVETKFRILFSELSSIKLQLDEKNDQDHVSRRKFEYLDNLAHFEEISLILCLGCISMASLYSLEQVCECLLRYNYGPSAIERLLANFPDQITKVADRLVECGNVFEVENFVSRKRFDALSKLCRLKPDFKNSLMKKCISEKKLAGLCFALASSSDMMHDFVATLNGCIFRKDISSKHYLLQFVQQCQKSNEKSLSSTCWRSFKDSLIEYVQGVPIDAERDVVLSTNVLKLLCALRGVANARFSDNELKLFLDFVTQCPFAPSPMTAKFVIIQLCYLFSFPANSNQNVEYEKATSYLKKLIQEESQFVNFSENYSKFLLLIAINFHSNQLSALSQIVSNVVGFKYQAKSVQLTRFKTIFTTELYPENVIAQCAVQLPVTKQLNKHSSGYLPIHCIHHLLNSKIFTKHKIDIKSWILEQLEECSLPVHPMVQTLLETYVTISVKLNDQCGAILDEKDISKYFGEKDDVFEGKLIVYRILLFYYALFYEECIIANSKTLDKNRTYLKSIAKVFENIPVYYYYTFVESHVTEFSTIYGSFIRLITNHFPHIFFNDTSIEQSASTSNDNVAKSADKKLAITVLTTCAYDNRTSAKLLTKILSNDKYYLNENFDDFLNTFCSKISEIFDINLQEEIKAKDASVSRNSPLIDVYGKLFDRLEKVHPLKLYVLTIRHLLPTKKNPFYRKLTYEALCDDPLIILKCDQVVFRRPPLLIRVLRILKCFLSAGRQAMHQKFVQFQPKNPQSEVECEELIRALIGARESAAVQILLENCLQQKWEQNNGCELNTLREVRRLICSHLHQVFIEDPMLIKLVHFQGYPEELVPMTTSCIPSMHICLDFVHEILSQPDHSKKIFAMILVSHICEQFTIPKAYSCAKLCVDVVEALMNVLPGQEAVAFFDAVFDSLCRFTKILPPLVNKVEKLFLQTAQSLKTRLNSQFLTLAPSDNYLPRLDLDYELKSAKKPRLNSLFETNLCAEERILKKINGWFRHDISDSILSIKL